MTIHLLTRAQVVPRPIGEVFRFFESPENLGLITPGWLNFQLFTPSPVPMRVGTAIDYSIRVAKIRVRWRTLITAHDPPHSFADIQIRGPYDFWHHSHLFRETEAGTEIRDEVRYAVGWGWIGAAANAIYVRRSLEEIFDFRAEAIGRILGGGGEIRRSEI